MAPSSRSSPDTTAPPSSKGRHIVGAERAALGIDLVERYRAGASINSLAASTGRSFGFIRNVLVEQGVGLRARGGDPRRGAGRPKASKA